VNDGTTMSDASVHPARTTAVLTVGAVWLALAVLVSATGAVARLRPPVPQIVLLALTALLILAGVKLPRFRAWLASVDIRGVVALHLTRLVAGAAFIHLHHRGQLPGAFALPAGWGDILVAVLAIPMLMFVPARGVGARRIYLAWNTLGLADILMVVANAAAHAVREPASMASLVRLPLSLLPMFLVPVIIASHVLLFVRLWRTQEYEPVSA
jgi:hypothetical protein